MPLPSMPSLSDLPGEELRKYHVVLKIFEVNFGEIHDPDCDGNFGYFATFQAFKFLVKRLKNRKLPSCAPNQKTAKIKRKELLLCGLDNFTHLVWHHNDSVPPNLVHLFLMVIHIF